MLQIQNVLYDTVLHTDALPNIRKLACVVLEKNVTEFFCDADDDARRRIVIPICRLR